MAISAAEAASGARTATAASTTTQAARTAPTQSAGTQSRARPRPTGTTRRPGPSARASLPEPPAIRAARAIRRVPKVSVRPKSGSQKLLFAAWGTAVGLSLIRDVAIAKDWPCPGRYVKITGLFLILGLLSEINPQAARLASMLGIGFVVVFLTREASSEIQKTGTFFGIKVK